MCFSLAHGNHSASARRQIPALHLVEFWSWIGCESFHFARLSASWQACLYTRRGNKSHAHKNGTFSVWRNVYTLGSWWKLINFLQKREKKMLIASLSLLCSLATSVGRFPLHFPMPRYLFSSLNLFILSGQLSAASAPFPKVWASC